MVGSRVRWAAGSTSFPSQACEVTAAAVTDLWPCGVCDARGTTPLGNRISVGASSTSNTVEPPGVSDISVMFQFEMGLGEWDHRGLGEVGI